MLVGRIDGLGKLSAGRDKSRLYDSRFYLELLRKDMLVPKRGRRHARLLLEESAEVGRVIKAQVIGNFLRLLIREED